MRVRMMRNSTNQLGHVARFSRPVSLHAFHVVPCPIARRFSAGTSITGPPMGRSGGWWGGWWLHQFQALGPTAAWAAGESLVGPPATWTVGKVNLIPLFSKADLISAKALLRMTNCS